MLNKALPGEEDHEADVERDDVQVELGQVKVLGDVQVDPLPVDVGEEVVDVVAKVQQVSERVVVEAEGLEDLVPQGLQGRQLLDVRVGEPELDVLQGGFQGCNKDFYQTLHIAAGCFLKVRVTVLFENLQLHLLGQYL